MILRQESSGGFTASFSPSPLHAKGPGHIVRLNISEDRVIVLGSDVLLKVRKEYRNQYKIR